MAVSAVARVTGKAGEPKDHRPRLSVREPQIRIAGAETVGSSSPQGISRHRILQTPARPTVGGVFDVARGCF